MDKDSSRNFSNKIKSIQEELEEWAKGSHTPPQFSGYPTQIDVSGTQSEYGIGVVEYDSVPGIGADNSFDVSLEEIREVRRVWNNIKDDPDVVEELKTSVKTGADFVLECKRKHHKQQTLNKYFNIMNESEEKVIVQPEGDTIKILRGVAPEPNNPEPVRISGHIDTPQRYYEKRAGDTFEKKFAHLEVNTQRKVVTLYVNPSDALAPVVSGSIKRYKPLKKLQINEGKSVSKDDFKIMLKKHRFLFKNTSDCSELVSRLENLEVKIDRELEDKDDSRGNRSLVVKQTVKAELPETIVLESQIFVEGVEHEIAVDLCYDVDSGGMLSFWLESATLYEMVEEQTRQMISDTVSNFGDEIPIIYG